MPPVNFMPTAPLRRPVLRDLSGNILLFLASRASVMGMFPFGFSFFAAGFDKGIAYIGIGVMCLGLISAGAALNTVKYLIAALLYWIYIKTRHGENKITESVICGMSVLVGGAAVLAYNYAGLYDIMLLLVEAVLSAVVYIVIIKSQDFMENRANRRNISREEIVSLAVCGGIFITGLSDINLPYGINLANIAAVYATLCIAFHSTLSASGSAAVCLGFMSVMSTPSSVLVGGLYGMGAMFANMLKSFGRIGIAVGFIGGMCAAIICLQGNEMPVSAMDISVSALMFVLTPAAVHKRINIFFSKSLHMEAISADVRLKEYLSIRLERISAAFKSLNESFVDESNNRLSSYKSEVGGFLDELTSRVCLGCSMSSKCWQNDFERTYKNVITLLEITENDGIAAESDMPKELREKCIRSERFLLEFNHVYELYKKDLIRTSEAAAERDIIARQYAETAQLFENISNDVLEGFAFREDYEETLVSELDKIGITAFEVSVVESSLGAIEVFLGLGIGIETEKVEELLSEMFERPMGLDKDSSSGGVWRFVSKARYSAEVAFRQIKSDESEISGDSIASFETEECKKYIILCDGMGSGKKAMRESRTTLKLLHEFLTAGFGIETSVEMINSALCLKLEDEMFSTIDLLCIDLVTGVAEFYKIGAAQSLISHDGNIETVYSSSLPAGMLCDIRPQGQTKRLSDGDTVIMMSDGISEAGNGTVRTEWIKQKLRCIPTDAEETAQDIMETVIEKSHGLIYDDMTVAAIKIIEN